MLLLLLLLLLRLLLLLAPLLLLVCEAQLPLVCVGVLNGSMRAVLGSNNH